MAAANVKEQIQWIETERDQEFCHRPRTLCRHCQTHRSWGNTCKHCLAEVWHILRGDWPKEPRIKDDS